MVFEYTDGNYCTVRASLLHITQRHVRAKSISAAHSLRAGTMEGVHRDPFDRLLAAQSLVEGFPLVTSDHLFKVFEVETVW